MFAGCDVEDGLINLSKMFGRFDKRETIDFAKDTKTKVDRIAIDAFLHRVLPEDEREFISSYFISDEASIFDCSMATAEDLQTNCLRAYGVRLSSQELKMPLYVLVDHVRALAP